METVAIDEWMRKYVVGHEGHDLAIHESKTTGRPHLVCHTCKESLARIQECEVYSRCCGYLRPVKQWNPGKQSEFGLRKEYRWTEKA